MLKIISSEVVRDYYLCKRVLVWYSRKTSWAKKEAQDIDVTDTNLQFRVHANDVDSYQDAQQIYNFINIKKSKGNYIVDADGETMLDVLGTESTPLGYNHDAFMKNLNNKEFDAFIINSSITSHQVASADYLKVVRRVLEPIAPRGLSAITLTHANQGLEKAIITAIAEKREKQTKWGVLGFTGQYRNQQSFALQQFSGESRFSSIGWPSAPYPKSSKEEESTLEDVSKALKQARSANKPVAAVTIQPVQFGTGYSVSQDFLTNLGKVARQNEASFIVDETSSCLSSGRGYWASKADADYVVFGKKTQVSGFFSRPESKQVANVFGGDQLKLLQFDIINDIIERDRLLDKQDKVGKHLRGRLESYVSKTGAIKSITGEGTHLYINTSNGDQAQKLWGHLISNGVVTKLIRGQGVALKPSLIFQEKHANQISGVLQKFKQ